MRRVGILGGMGPEATVMLQQRLIRAVQARDDADHVPLIVDMNPQVPSRLAHLVAGDGPDPGPVLAAMARRLQAAGAEALAMPCNTAHHYAPAIRAACPLPFLDMVALAAEHVAALAGGGPVGMLASPAVRLTGLFERALPGPVLWPGDEAPLAAIRHIKAHGPDATARAALGTISAGLRARGAAVQMIACTEFSLIPGSVAPGVQILDTLDVLVGAIVAFAGAVPAGQITLPSA